MDDPLVVGVDPSARKIAIVAHQPVVLSTVVFTSVLYKTPGKQTPESLAKAVEAMESFLTQVALMGHGPKYAWVEDPLIGRGGAVTTMKQSLVQGIVRGMLARAGFTVYGVNVSTWKKDVVGNGRAEKSDVARTVKIKWPKIMPLLGGDGDLVDAAAINIFGQAVLRKASAAHVARSA